jgi:hypothetical protein
MDPLTALLSQAISDALAWRLHTGRPCTECGDSLCEQCSADWAQADRYHELARTPGAIGNKPLGELADRHQGHRRPPAPGNLPDPTIVRLAPRARSSAQAGAVTVIV